MEIIGPVIFIGGIALLMVGWYFYQRATEARNLADSPVTIERDGQEYRVTFAVEQPPAAGLTGTDEGTIVATVEARAATGWRHVGQHRTPFRPHGYGSPREHRGSYGPTTRRQIAEEALGVVVVPRH
jgi:hypothetical protein